MRVKSDGGLFKALITIALFASVTDSVIACTCVADPLSKRYRKASAVFIGQAVDKSAIPQNSMLVQGKGQQTVAVLKAWKGIKRKFIEVNFAELTSSAVNCPTLFFFEPGKRYLVFAYGRTFEVHTVCSDTWQIPSSNDAPGFEQIQEFIKKLDSTWFRFRSRLRIFG
jgi:hypothetical protein